MRKLEPDQARLRQKVFHRKEKEKERKPLSPASPAFRVLQRQANYVAIAVAIYAALWAADRPASLGSTLAYTVPLCNFIALVQENLRFLYGRKRPLHSWTIYTALILLISVFGVAIVNLTLYPSHRVQGQSVWEFLISGWKFPFMATLIVGMSFELYRRTRERLETRNRELQRKIELEAERQNRHDQELEQAREIQQSLLPKNIPQLSGFQIDVSWQPARVVGGDYFDVIRFSDDSLGICIADVVGKSVPAALLMASVQASVRAFATEEAAPSALCSRVNSVLCSNIGAGKFVTFFYGLLDRQKRSFRYANAGHPFPILIGEDGEALELGGNGAVLGVFPDWKYEESEVIFHPGDRLLLFTDGLTEAGLPLSEEFGSSRLLQAACTHLREPNTVWKDSIVREVKSFCAAQFHDDMTLIAISAVPANLPESADKPELADATATVLS